MNDELRITNDEYLDVCFHSSFLTSVRRLFVFSYRAAKYTKGSI